MAETNEKSQQKLKTQPKVEKKIVIPTKLVQDSKPIKNIEKR